MEVELKAVIDHDTASVPSTDQIKELDPKLQEAEQKIKAEMEGENTGQKDVVEAMEEKEMEQAGTDGKISIKDIQREEKVLEAEEKKLNQKK